MQCPMYKHKLTTKGYVNLSEALANITREQSCRNDITTNSTLSAAKSDAKQRETTIFNVGIRSLDQTPLNRCVCVYKQPRTGPSGT